jgi:hypothetical protein
VGADEILIPEIKNLRLLDTGFLQLHHECRRFNRSGQEMDTGSNALPGRDHAGDSSQCERIDPLVAAGFKNNARFQHRAPASGTASYTRHYESSDGQLVAAKYTSHEPRPEFLGERQPGDHQSCCGGPDSGQIRVR